MAGWLDVAFYGFDTAILGFWNSVAQGAGKVLTPIMEVISFFGWKGIAMIVLGVVLLLFKKTRRLGVGALIAIAFGALFTNVLIKNLVARARPYTHEQFIPWWNAVGSPVESEYSFPSGHTTVVTSALTGIFLTSKQKKYTWTLIFGIILVGISRNYLMVHYPTDVIAGVIVGGVSATISLFVTKGVYKLIEKKQENKVCSFILNACILDLFKKKQVEKTDEEE